MTLICNYIFPLGNQMNTTVPLTLPEVFIEGSAQSFVTVIGELKDVLGNVKAVQ